MLTQVVNLRQDTCDIYIGRRTTGSAPEKEGAPGFWGNPFVIGTDGDRATVIAKYRNYVLAQPTMLARLSELRGKTLGCWCKPAACHGDVLVELVAERDTAGDRPFDPRMQDARVITRAMPNYPRQLWATLNDRAPRTLTVKGNLDLLTAVGVGVSGSRKPSNTGLAVARQIGREMAAHAYIVVSGYADGIDIAAHQAVLKAGGATIFVLAEGMNHLVIKREIADLLTPTNHLFVSQWPADALWAGYQAMQRNSTIIGLSDTLIITEARADGGTYGTGLAALRLDQRFFVLDYPNGMPTALGNPTLIAQGGIPLAVTGSGVVDVSPVLTALENA